MHRARQRLCLAISAARCCGFDNMRMYAVIWDPRLPSGSLKATTTSTQTLTFRISTISPWSAKAGRKRWASSSWTSNSEPLAYFSEVCSSGMFPIDVELVGRLQSTGHLYFIFAFVASARDWLSANYAKILDHMLTVSFIRSNPRLVTMPLIYSSWIGLLTNIVGDGKGTDWTIKRGCGAWASVLQNQLTAIAATATVL